nr:hypothetical protein Iba_chr03bCG2450 [Ipomoea batatas]
MALRGGRSDKEKHFLRLFMGGLEANKHAAAIPLGDLDITRGSGSYSVGLSKSLLKVEVGSSKLGVVGEKRLHIFKETPSIKFITEEENRLKGAGFKGVDEVGPGNVVS